MSGNAPGGQGVCPVPGRPARRPVSARLERYLPLRAELRHRAGDPEGADAAYAAAIALSGNAAEREALERRRRRRPR